METVTISLERYKELLDIEYTLVGKRKKAGDKISLKERYRNIRYRCYNPKHASRRYYLDKGITMCDEWLESFESFEKWSLMNGYDRGLTIERIDNKKGYSPENCKWVTMAEQSRNKTSNRLITIGSETKILMDWCLIYNISFVTASGRLDRGWSVEDTFKKEVAKHKRFSHYNMVLNTETGIYYEKASDAAKAHNIYYPTLKNQLYNKRKSIFVKV